jgi:DNA-binding response OmpR family regulator
MDLLEAVPKPRYPVLIYVVEDDPDVSHLIEHNLRAAGFDVSTFFSGAPVVPQAALAMPSLFLLDIMLPGMNGFDLCREIRQHEHLAKTPVIFLSAKTQEPDRLQAFEVGADGYITKPFSPRELIARIRNVLRVHAGNCPSGSDSSWGIGNRSGVDDRARRGQSSFDHGARIPPARIPRSPSRTRLHSRSVA